MINMRNMKLLYFFSIIAILCTLFSVHVSQTMSNNTENEPIKEEHLLSTQENTKKSKLKKRYKTLETQEKIIDIATLALPLKVLCINQLIDNNLITEEVESEIKEHALLPLLKTVLGIKQAGYRNKKLVSRLIRLTLDHTLSPPLRVLQKNLYEAAFLKDENALALLISKGALEQELYDKNQNVPFGQRSCRIDCKGKQKFWPNLGLEKALIRATRKNQLEIVKLLLDKLEHNPEIYYNIFDDGLTYAKSINMVNLYLEKNANLNVGFGPRDANCLGNAVIDGNIELVDFLLTHGSSPIIADESYAESITPVTYVLEKFESKDPAARELGKKFLKKFAYYSSENSANVLIQIMLNAISISEETMLEAITIVLETNAIDINEQDPDNGWTALMYASDNLLYSIVEKLIQHDADISIINDDNQNALELARLRLIDNYTLRHTDRQCLKNAIVAQKIMKLLYDTQISQSD